MTITTYAKHSKEYKSYIHARTNSSLVKSRKTGKNHEFTSEDIEKEEISLFSNITKTWSITYDGKKIKFSPEKAKEVYSELSWIREQLDEAISSEDVFT
jgi:hypothetical protein